MGTKIKLTESLQKTIQFEQKLLNAGINAEARNCTVNAISYPVLKAQPSLVLTPSAYGTNQAYSIIPTDNSGDFTCTRGTTAMRRNEDGLWEETPYNLVSYSEEFNTGTWIKVGGTVTANVEIAPNNTTTADLIVESNTFNNHRIMQSLGTLSSGDFKISIRFKSGVGTRNLELGFIAGPSFIATVFDTNTGQFILNNDSVGSVFVNKQNNVSSIDNFGYYTAFISFTLLSSQPSSILVGLTSGITNNYLGDGTSGIYIWGAQVTQGSTPKPYLKTTDRLNVPRLHYPVGGGCPSWLVEPQRTNLLLYSQEFDNFYWLKEALIVSNTLTQPDGGTTGFSIKESLTNTYQYIYRSSFIININTDYVFSCYVKYETLQYIQLSVYNGGNYSSACFDLINLTFTTATFGPYTVDNAKIESEENGWYRISFVFRSTAATDVIPSVCASNTPNAGYIPLYTGTGLQSAIWQAQLEVGSFATSPIPTTSATVTRNADVLSKILPTSLGFTGTIFIDFEDILTVGTGFGFTDLLANNAYIFYFYSGGIDVTNGASFIVNRTVLQPSKSKVAVVFQPGSVKVFINGVNRTLPGATPSIRSCDRFNAIANGAQLFQPKTMALYPTALSDAECIQLTTL